MQRLCTLLVLACATSAGAQSPVAGQTVTLVVPAAADVAWRGISADEPAGSQGIGMLYPAPNIAGFLAAILTHAAVVHGAAQSERQARAALADKILEPHRAATDRLTPAVLVEDVVARVRSPVMVASTAGAGSTARGLAVEMKPVFALSSDRRMLVLDNAVRVADAAATPPVAIESVIRVVSTPRREEDTLAFWTADDGKALREESTAMLAHAIHLALSFQDKADAAIPFRTQRYMQGTEERMERGSRSRYIAPA